MATKKLDNRVAALMQKVKSERAEIAKIKKPQWLTSQTIELPSGNRATLSVISDLQQLASMRGLLKRQLEDIEDTAHDLGVGITTKWHGYEMEDWITDIEQRIKTLTVSERQEKLKALEKKLYGLTSEEQRREMELAEIEAELGDDS